jgi:signal transduction histidine kinase
MLRRFLGSYGELVLVFGLGVLAQAELWLDSRYAADRRGLAMLALGMTATLLLRVRLPLLTLAMLFAAIQIETLALSLPGNDDPMSLILILMVGLYSAGAHTRGPSLLVACLVVAVAIAVSAVEDGDSLNVGGLLFFSFFLAGPFLTGVAIRIRRERERLLVSDRDEKARAAVAEERTRIARELHDVVAHAIGVIVLQARGARRSLEDEPNDARAAIDAIESTAAGALTEMRRLLGVLRAGDEEVALAPQPSLSQVEILAGKVREAGMPVEVSIVGSPRELPPGVDLSAYRIVQEALTNALKHAGPARARVLIRYGDEHVEVEVADDGSGATNGAGGGNHGLIGMRERVALFGGELETGPRDGGGFAVRARLPL